jgi:hypothetical protein
MAVKTLARSDLGGPQPPSRLFRLAVEREQKRSWASEADARIRTADPFITSEVLYQLSYVGAYPFY